MFQVFSSVSTAENIYPSPTISTNIVSGYFALRGSQIINKENPANNLTVDCARIIHFAALAFITI